MNGSKNDCTKNFNNVAETVVVGVKCCQCDQICRKFVT